MWCRPWIFLVDCIRNMNDSIMIFIKTIILIVQKYHQENNCDHINTFYINTLRNIAIKGCEYKLVSNLKAY